MNVFHLVMEIFKTKFQITIKYKRSYDLHYIIDIVYILP